MSPRACSWAASVLSRAECAGAQVKYILWSGDMDRQFSRILSATRDNLPVVKFGIAVLESEIIVWGVGFHMAKAVASVSGRVARIVTEFKSFLERSVERFWRGCGLRVGCIPASCV